MCLPTNTTQYHADQDRQREGHRAARFIQTWVALNYEIMSPYTLSWPGFWGVYICARVKSMNTLTFLSKIFPADSDIQLLKLHITFLGDFAYISEIRPINWHTSVS